jgi:hypothetical protein
MRCFLTASNRTISSITMLFLLSSASLKVRCKNSNYSSKYINSKIKYFTYSNRRQMHQLIRIINICYRCSFKRPMSKYKLLVNKTKIWLTNKTNYKKIYSKKTLKLIRLNNYSKIVKKIILIKKLNLTMKSKLMIQNQSNKRCSNKYSN